MLVESMNYSQTAHILALPLIPCVTLDLSVSVSSLINEGCNSANLIRV